MTEVAPRLHHRFAPPAPLPPNPVAMCGWEYWPRLAPSLHVCDRSFMRACRPLRLTNDQLRQLKSQMLHEGYFHLPPMDWNLPLPEMADVIRRLASFGAPPVLAFHYDEFWLMYKQLEPLLRTLLGDDPVMLPEFWAWHVDPKHQGAGWAPHRDRGHTSLLPDGSAKVVTLWLPLTDATPLNGCLYIVPADRDPTYGTAEEGWHGFSLADIRALPARSGSILGWNQAVLHWGSHAADRDTPPRISIACEFQRRDVEPYNQHLLDFREPPDMAARQAAIGHQILRYQHMDDVGDDWRACAQRLVAGADPPDPHSTGIARAATA